jgi:ribose 5-phosphate isomerase A
MEDKEKLKQSAAESAVDYIQPGMVLGLGTGSTALLAVKMIAQLLQSKLLRNIVAVPSSLITEKEALRLGITLTTLDQHHRIDLTIDGADEVDTELNLIKGRGGALLREKILIQS